MTRSHRKPRGAPSQVLCSSVELLSSAPENHNGLFVASSEHRQTSAFKTIPLLSCPSQLWFTPWPGDTESPVLHPGFGCVSQNACSQAGDRAGSQQLVTSGSLQAEGVSAGSWRVASPGSSWRMSTMAAVSYLEVEEL